MVEGAMEKDDDRDICKKFGARVRRRRREIEMSQEELAERAAIHRTYLSSLERSGARNPTIRVAHRIATALGVSVGSLLD